MVDVTGLSPQTLSRLTARAQQAGCSVDSLVAQMLNVAPPPGLPPDLYRRLLDETRDTISVFDTDLRYLYVNPVMAEMGGLDPADMIGRTDAELGIDPQLVARLRRAWQQVIDSGQEQIITFDYPTPYGLRHYESRMSPIYAADGTLQCLLAISRDITPHVIARSEQREQQALLDAFITQSRDAVRIIDEQERIIVWNPASETMTGLKREHVIGKPFSEVTAQLIPDDLRSPEALNRYRASVQAMIQRIMTGESGVFLQQEHRSQAVDGTVRHVETLLFPVNVGERHYLCSIVRDTSERHEAQEALRQSEQLYRLIAENTSDGIVIMDGPTSTVTYASPAYDRQWGREIGGSVGIDSEQVYQIIHPEDRDPLFRRIYQAIDDHVDTLVYSYRARHSDGQYYWKEDHTRFIYDEAGVLQRSYVISRDVTARKQLEQALAEREERYRLLTQLTSDYVVASRVDPDGTAEPEWIEGAFEAITGYTRPTERPGPDGWPQVYPDDYAQWQAEQQRTITANERTTSECRIIRPDGSIRWLGIQRHPVWDDTQGRVVRMYSAVQDITERKDYEASLLENERLKARFQKEHDRNALVQRVIAALSHDLRTPLSVISLSKDMLARHFKRMTDDQREQRLEAIDRQVQFVQHLLEDTVHLARGGGKDEAEFRPGAVNLEALCRISIEEVSAANGTRHRLSFSNPGAVGTVSVDEVLISRILLNLLSNAVKYSPDGSEVRLTLDRSDGAVVLRVSDEGSGIAPADLPHIFEPFYRARMHEALRGTGLGLSIVQDCVQRHRGYIDVDSTPGKGSTFTVTLPVVQPSA